MNIYRKSEIPPHLIEYFDPAEIGMEHSPEEYVATMVQVFGLVRDVLADDGTLWLNLGDSYANDGKWGGHTGGKHAKAIHASAIGRNKRHTGLKPKDLIGIPWRVAFALQADGWYLRSDIIWHKPNPMPESVTDRPTKAHEYLFLMAKSERYYFDQDAIKEHGSMRQSGNSQHKYANGQELHRTKAGLVEIHKKQYEKVNKRTVWTVPTEPSSEAHFATFPSALIKPCILAGAAAGGVVLDPFMGSGTTARVALSLGRQFIGCELNQSYIDIQDKIGMQAGMAL